MSVREKIKSLEFVDGGADLEGPWDRELMGWSALFCLRLHGDETTYVGTVTETCGSSDDPEWDEELYWDDAPGMPPGDAQFRANLERFVITAFRRYVGVRFVIEPVILDDVESDYLEEEDEEEEVTT